MFLFLHRKCIILWGEKNTQSLRDIMKTSQSFFSAVGTSYQLVFTLDNNNVVAFFNEIFSLRQSNIFFLILITAYTTSILKRPENFTAAEMYPKISGKLYWPEKFSGLLRTARQNILQYVPQLVLDNYKMMITIRANQDTAFFEVAVFAVKSCI